MGKLTYTVYDIETLKQFFLVVCIKFTLTKTKNECLEISVFPTIPGFRPPKDVTLFESLIRQKTKLAVPINFGYDLASLQMYFNDIITNNYPIVGYNNHNYDDKIIIGVLYKKKHPKIINDMIINSTDYINYKWHKTLSIDCYLEIKSHIGLKKAALNLGLSVIESETDFTYEGELSLEQLVQVTEYCINDVILTNKIFLLRRTYFNTKLSIADTFGINICETFSKSDTVVVAEILKARKSLPSINKKVLYHKRPEIEKKLTHTPQVVIDWYNSLYDKHKKGKLKSIKDLRLFYNPETKEHCFDKNNTKDIITRDYLITYSLGGTHTYNTFNQYQKVLAIDVSSYYTFLMINNDLMIDTKNPQLYIDIKDIRLDHKKHGRDMESNNYKFLLNKPYGMMGQMASNAYNPPVRMAVCVYGNLILNELLFRLVDIGVDIAQGNTDGIMIYDYENKYDQISKIVKTWCKDFSFEVEEDKYDFLYQPSVNHYFMQDYEGKIKPKGFFKKYDKQSMFKEMDFSNNTLSIVPMCIINHKLYGISYKDTIAKEISNYNLLAFQKPISTSGKKPRIMINGEISQYKYIRAFVTTNGDKEIKGVKFGYMREMIIKHNKEMLEKLKDYVPDDIMEGITLKKNYISNIKKEIKKQGLDVEAYELFIDELVPPIKRGLSTAKKILEAFDKTGEPNLADKETIVPSRLSIYNDEICDISFDLNDSKNSDEFIYLNNPNSSEILNSLDIEWYTSLVEITVKKMEINKMEYDNPYDDEL